MLGATLVTVLLAPMVAVFLLDENCLRGIFHVTALAVVDAVLTQPLRSSKYHDLF